MKAKLVDLVEFQSKEGFRKHFKTSEIISKIITEWNETQIDLSKQGLSSKETQLLIDDQRTYSFFKTSDYHFPIRRCNLYIVYFLAMM